MQATDTYRRPAFLLNAHLETIYPAAFRTVQAAEPMQERITTPDQDFLDLDWYQKGSDKLVIVSHGLEGNSRRPYVLGMVKAFTESGFDALTWNYRGCGIEMNKQVRFYHSGATDDLNHIVSHALAQKKYRSISLVGFSLGGNLTLKYLGEPYESVKAVSHAVAISVPLDLDSSCTALSRPHNWIYVRRFLKSLKSKVRDKAKLMTLPIETDLSNIKTLRQFDDAFTAPLHGFKDATDYYAKNSSLIFLPAIKVHTLLINAYNDPFLSLQCLPRIDNPNITTLYPRHGGHVGFASFNRNSLYWSEMQALAFCRQL